MYKALDLFCCGGGASSGLATAGFDVTGVDIEPQPTYPFRFIQADALEVPLAGYDFIWASPPCQAYSACYTLWDKSYPDLIAPVRDRLKKTGIPYIIENVEGSPLLNPVMLCGTMFGLKTYRHRMFESNVALVSPPHPAHLSPVTKMGRRAKSDEFITPVGNFSGVDRVRQMFQMPWASRYQLAQAVPPQYADYLGLQIHQHILMGSLEQEVA